MIQSMLSNMLGWFLYMREWFKLQKAKKSCYLNLKRYENRRGNDCSFYKIDIHVKVNTTTTQDWKGTKRTTCKIPRGSVCGLAHFYRYELYKHTEHLIFSSYRLRLIYNYLQQIMNQFKIFYLLLNAFGSYWHYQ